MAKRDLDRRQLERQASVGRYVGYLFHQVRSPVVTIGLLARSVRRQAKLTGAEREKIDQIIEHVSKIETMLTGCLDYLRPAREGAERVNVANLVRWVGEAMKPQAEEAKVTLEADLADGLPVLLGHRRLLREALLNVVHNAVEAAAASGGTVTLRARASGRYLILAVTDTGNGMPPELVQEAFEPFVTTKKRGTGLGLPLTRKVVEDHGGRVSIESAPGEGTRVTVRLPLTTPRAVRPGPGS